MNWTPLRTATTPRSIRCFNCCLLSFWCVCCCSLLYYSSLVSFCNYSLLVLAPSCNNHLLFPITRITHGEEERGSVGEKNLNLNAKELAPWEPEIGEMNRLLLYKNDPNMKWHPAKKRKTVILFLGSDLETLQFDLAGRTSQTSSVFNPVLCTSHPSFFLSVSLRIAAVITVERRF